MSMTTRAAQQAGVVQEAIEGAAKIHKKLDLSVEADCEKDIASVRSKYALVREDLAAMMAQAISEIEACHHISLKNGMLDEDVQKLHEFTPEKSNQSPPPDVQEMENVSWITTSVLMKIIEQRTSVNSEQSTKVPMTTRVAQHAGVIQEAKKDAAKVHKELDSIIEADCEKEIASMRLKYALMREDLEAMMAQAISEIETCHQISLKKRLLNEVVQKLHDFTSEKSNQSPPPDVQEMAKSASWITTTLTRIIESRTKSAPTGHSLASPVLQAGSRSRAMNMIPIRLDQCLVPRDVDGRPLYVPGDAALRASHSRGRARAPAPHWWGSLPR